MWLIPGGAAGDAGSPSVLATELDRQVEVLRPELDTGGIGAPGIGTDAKLLEDRRREPIPLAKKCRGLGVDRQPVLRQRNVVGQEFAADLIGGGDERGDRRGALTTVPHDDQLLAGHADLDVSP